MTTIDERCAIERTIGDSMKKITAQSAPPPFTAITERIAAGQPSEGFEEFFAGDRQTASAIHADGRRRRHRIKILAAASAAALLLLIGGGAALGTLLGGSLTKAESAADAYETGFLYENAEESHYADNALAEDCENTDSSNVSDSDAKDTGSEKPDDSGGN